MISRIRFLSGCLALFVMALVAGPAFAQEGEPATTDNYPRMTVEELKQLIDTGATSDFVIVDNQPAETFGDGHIPGAVNLPWTDQISGVVKLPRNKTLVMYCPCLAEEDAIDMANKLSVLGYRKFKLLKGGWFKWEEMKFPIETGAGGA